ncbi:MAG TPA: hypothetical protein VGJ26_09690 [Pirellulales bacterium]|jgi:hypothetical protein
MPRREEVSEFLSDFKTAVRLGFVHWMERADSTRKHQQCLVDLNLTLNQAVELLSELTPDDYCQGPEADDVQPSRSVWVFGTDIGSDEVYIKLTLQPDNRRKSVVHGLVWSFHRADYPLKYPLRGP